MDSNRLYYKRKIRKKAVEKLEQFKIEYEQKSKIKLRDPNIYDKYKNILFCDYMLEWLEKQKRKS